MISQEKFTDIAYQISNRFDAINSEYIKLMAQHIKEIGTLNPSSIRRMDQMIKMGANVRKINEMMAEELNLTLNELDELYTKSGLDQYSSVAHLYRANGVQQVPFLDNTALQNYIQSVKQLTANTLVNLANTTAVSKTYKDMLDTATEAVASGVADYQSVIRTQLKNAATRGMRVEYASGVTRRLDSAVRMNILEGVRQVNNGVRQISGQQFGADGVEISAHGLCAEDHLHLQGQQYSNKQFEEVNTMLPRRLSTCNCKHITFPIILGISEPAYSNEEIARMNAYSNQKVTVDGTEMTRYQASQLMRRTETAIRYQKDAYIAGEASGDGVLMKRSRDKIRQLQAEYKEICNKSGLSPRPDRYYVPGYGGGQSTPQPISVKTIDKPVNSTKPKTLHEERMEALTKLVQLEPNNPACLGVIQDFGNKARTDVKEALDKRLEKATNFEKNEYSKALKKYNEDYAILADKYMKDGYTFEQATQHIDNITGQVDDYLSYLRWAEGELSDTTKQFYTDRAQAVSNKIAAQISQSKYLEDWSKLTDSYQVYKEAERTLKNMKNFGITDNIQLAKDLLGKYRKLGIDDTSRITAHLNKSRSPMRKIVEEAYQLYPQEWVNNSINHGNLTPKKVDRGYYSHFSKEIAISGYSDSHSLETAIHELGHRFERTQNLKQYEKLLYDKRTAGEDLQWLGAGYGKAEKTRVDNWLSKYMGKDYGGTAYEIISMGFEYAYTNPDLLLQDEEFANFIYGILTLL